MGEVLARDDISIKAKETIYNICKSPIGIAYFLELQDKAEYAVTQAQSHMMALTPRAVRVIDKRLPSAEGEEITEEEAKAAEDTAWRVLDRTFPKTPTHLINVNNQTNIAVLEKEAHAMTEAELIEGILVNRGADD